MIELMLTAPASGSGKTVLTCALLAALKKRGCSPCAFKCGPDYIDPMFHRTVLDVESHNLDLFLSDEAAVRKLYARYSAGHGAVVVEGAMGFYDGLGGTTHRAQRMACGPHVGSARSAGGAAQGGQPDSGGADQGAAELPAASHIAGVLLNDCTPMQAKSLSPMLEQETGLPVVGYLPHLEEAGAGKPSPGPVHSRGSGGSGPADRRRGGARLEQTVDWTRLLALCGGKERPEAAPCSGKGAGPHRGGPGRGLLLYISGDAGRPAGGGRRAAVFQPR